MRSLTVTFKNGDTMTLRDTSRRITALAAYFAGHLDTATVTVETETLAA